MTSRLVVTVIPAEELAPDQQARQRLFARLRYERVVPNDDVDRGAPKAARLESSVRDELSAEGKAVIAVDDRAAGTPVTLQIESGQGGVLWTSEPQLRGDRVTEVRFAIPVDVYKAAGSPSTPAESPLLIRGGRFVRFDDHLPRSMATGCSSRRYDRTPFPKAAARTRRPRPRASCCSLKGPARSRNSRS